MLTKVLRTIGILLLLAPASLAQSRASRTFIGQDIFVASGQQVHNALCLFCSVQVEGDLTGHVIVLFGNLNVIGRVDRSASVIGGNVVIDSQARIGGDTLVLGGNAVYESDESISGSAYVLGGHLSKTGDRAHSRRRLSLGPVLFSSLAVIGFILLSLLLFPHTRRRSEVGQPT